MIAFDIADLILAAVVAGAGAIALSMHHRNAIDTVSMAKAVAVGKLAKSLKAARMEIAELAPRAAKVSDLEADLARARSAINAHAARNASLTERNEKLEREFQDYARQAGESFEDIGLLLDDPEISDPILMARSFNEQDLRRDMLERITVAHIFDCVQHARGPLMPWAKALGLGPFKKHLKKPILDQASDVLDAMGAFEAISYPRSMLRSHFEAEEKKALASAAKTASGKRGGSQK